MKSRTETGAATARGSREPGGSTYPFAALVGLNAARRALSLLAVEPGLKGALIASGSSSEAQSLLRSFAAILADTDDRLAGAHHNHEMPVVEVPVNVTEDRLLGAIDLEHTIKSGRREVLPGLLAEANGGVLLVGDINLVDSGIANHIAHALDCQRVVIERDGVSAVQPANFRLLGCFDRAEGEPHSLFARRVDLIVESPQKLGPDERAEAIASRLRFEKDPVRFAEEFLLETAALKNAIEEARTRLPRVRFSRDNVRTICEIALKLGVQGSRADLAALKTARANAALIGRSAVDDDDIVVAIQLVLAPRATSTDVRREYRQREQTSEAASSLQDEGREEGTGDPGSASGSIQDLMIKAIDAQLPMDLISTSNARPLGGRAGKHAGASAYRRGRYVRSVTRRNHPARIAIDGTLRAAAPYQSLRRSRDGMHSGSEAAHVDRRVRIDRRDLRFKQLKHRSGMLFILAVDASGSMAVNRLAQAKGALTRLLGRAYLYRDKVALISFRGMQAEVLLPPTRSVELAKRVVEALPAGGATPISAAVLKAAELARLVKLRGLSQAMLVLFTDGRANVGLPRQFESTAATTIDQELRQLGRLLHSQGIASVVVDTKSRFVSAGEARELARMLGSRYLYLPRFDPAAVQKQVYRFAEELRR